MADILKAIEIEGEYLIHRMNDEEPFHLKDEIEKCGFKSLDDYFEAKREYEFEKLKFTETDITQEEVLNELSTVFENKTIGVWFCDHPKTCVFGGYQGIDNFNEEYCIENDIVVYPFLSGGGIIVHKDGDFTYGLSCPNNLNIDAGFILDKTRRILQKYTNKRVTVDGNDILVNGLKVCGSTVYNKNGLFLILIYFSFNDKSELIKSICNKEMIKKPAYIDFMTREQLRLEVAKWLSIQST